MNIDLQQAACGNQVIIKKKKLENYFKNSLKSVSSAQKQACCKIYG